MNKKWCSLGLLHACKHLYHQAFHGKSTKNVQQPLPTWALLMHLEPATSEVAISTRATSFLGSTGKRAVQKTEASRRTVTSCSKSTSITLAFAFNWSSFFTGVQSSLRKNFKKNIKPTNMRKKSEEGALLNGGSKGARIGERYMRGGGPEANRGKRRVQAISF